PAAAYPVRLYQLKVAVSRSRVVSRVTMTCSRERKGPVSPVPAARFPAMAAATTSHGWRVSRKTVAETTISAAWAMRAARGPHRPGGAANQERRGVAGGEGRAPRHAELAGVHAHLHEVDGQQHAQGAVAESPDGLRDEDELCVTPHERAAPASSGPWRDRPTSLPNPSIHELLEASTDGGAGGGEPVTHGRHIWPLLDRDPGRARATEIAAERHDLVRAGDVAGRDATRFHAAEVHALCTQGSRYGGSDVRIRLGSGTICGHGKATGRRKAREIGGGQH